MFHMKHQSRRVLLRGMIEGQAHGREQDLEHGTMAVLGHETGENLVVKQWWTWAEERAKPDHETVAVLGHETGKT